MNGKNRRMKKILLIVILSLSNLFLYSQIAITTDGSTPDNSAMLDVRSSNKGLLLPRVALKAINVDTPLVSPAIGLRVYNTATAGTIPNNVVPGNYYWNGTRWVSLSPPLGVNIGDMLYWNGAQWIGVPVGTNGQVLVLNNGIPAWGGTQLPVVTTTAISGIAGYSAYSGGRAICYGGAYATLGVCWSTSPNPTTANSKTINGSGGMGSFTSTMTNLSVNTLYYVRAYATNAAGTAYGNQVSFTTLLYGIGQSYGGGIIFYVDGTGLAGLISSTSDQGIVPWGCFQTSIPGTSTALGTGQTNTTAIVNGCSEAGIAARICDDLVLNGYSDWYLPSKDELSQMSSQQSLIGNITYGDNYWSSSEESGFGAWTIQLNPGSQGYTNKSISRHVRAIRSFSSLPAITTNAVMGITQTTATSGGNITSDGGTTITARGVCWSTSANPTIADSKTTDGTGTGAFVSNLTGLALNTVYYVRAYATNTFGTSYGNGLSFSTQFCTSPLTINHVAGTLAPVTKTVNYSLVTNIPGETSKCWITSNLGADQQATAVNDATEASAGWYWQFNRKQGYKHDGTTRTPNTAWISSIVENFDWEAVNDPCTLELGTGWRIPTSVEWTNVDASGSWTNWNGPWNSSLKLHAAGCLFTGGSLNYRGSQSYFWSSTQFSTSPGWYLEFGSGYSNMSTIDKALGFSLRCIKNPPNPVLPTITTAPVTNISQTTATSGGTGISDGGALVTSRGVCWSTSANPTTANSYSNDGDGTGNFVSALTGLTPNTLYHVRAYATNSAGTGYGNEVTFTTPAVFICSSPITINHVAGAIAPVNKTVAYGTVTNIPGETSKCWITSNLGADHQATAVNDATEASAGWYWQFNRKQGYKHDGTARTPNTTWITTISENSDWTTANDPCNLELGTPWRIPTYTEWFNADNNGSWTNWNGPWGSGLKIHAAGYLNSNNGTLGNRGIYGDYWGSTQNSVTNGNLLTFGNVSSAMAFYDKAFGFSVRCLRE
jgi:hypothetical protein